MQQHIIRQCLDAFCANRNTPLDRSHIPASNRHCSVCAAAFRIEAERFGGVFDGTGWLTRAKKTMGKASIAISISGIDRNSFLMHFDRPIQIGRSEESRVGK